MAFTCMQFPQGLLKFALVFPHGPVCSSRSHPTFSAAITTSEKAALLQTATVAGAAAELSGQLSLTWGDCSLIPTGSYLTTGQRLDDRYLK